MTVYQVETHKVGAAIYGIGGWSNVYHVNAADVDEALDQGVTFGTIEQGAMSTGIVIVDTTAFIPGVRGSGGRRNIGLTGARTASGAVLPPWNVGLCSVKSALTSFRLKKYYRIGLAEGDVIGQVLESAVKDLLITVIQDIVNDTNICMPDGTIVDSGSWFVSDYINMRQPGWARRGRPGYKRGWVAV